MADNLMGEIVKYRMREDALDSSLAWAVGMKVWKYGAWYPAGNLLVEDKAPERKPLRVRAWLFEPRRISYVGKPHDLIDCEGRPLIVGDLLRKDDMYFIVRSRGGINFSEFDGEFFSIKPSRWSVFLLKHPKIDDFVTRFRAAKHAWQNPNEGDDYDDDY